VDLCLWFCVLYINTKDFSEAYLHYDKCFFRDALCQKGWKSKVKVNFDELKKPKVLNTIGLMSTRELRGFMSKNYKVLCLPTMWFGVYRIMWFMSANYVVWCL
jgi:hypothetical protein